MLLCVAVDSQAVNMGKKMAMQKNRQHNILLNKQ